MIVESECVGRYVERLICPLTPFPGSGPLASDLDFLQAHGVLRAGPLHECPLSCIEPAKVDLKYTFDLHLCLLATIFEHDMVSTTSSSLRLR